MGTNDFGYQYDAIGNRQVAIANAETNLYDANALNQYASVLLSAGPPAYDADGNMISNGTFTYSWDAENRLVEIHSNGTVVVRNAYDFMGRRVRKASATGTNTFLYDGWNLLRESSISNNQSEIQTNKSSFVWGLDLSGSRQGAGGVGGLLCQVQERDGSPSRPLFSFSDANGNLTDLVDTNGTSVAHYEYGPFGETTAQTGSLASENPFRFSTKYQDDESGLYYYGYRFYSPELGRWLNRDPIGEDGGINLFSMCHNNPINYVDSYGLYRNPDSDDVLSENKSITINIGGNPDLQWIHTDKYVKRYSIYRGARKGREHFGSFNGWSVEPRNMRKIKKVNSCCAKVIRNVSFLVETETSIIDRQYIGQSGSVTARGWDEVHAHEYRRVKSVLLGATAYLAPIAGTGYAALKCGVVCDDNGVDAAVNKLSKYLASLQVPAEQQVSDYYWSQKGKIDNEKWVMKGDLHDYHVNIRFDPPPPYKPIECPK